MTALLSFLPDLGGLLNLLPALLGGGGGMIGLLGFIPGLEKYALIGLAVLLVGAIVFGVVERGNYESEVAARATDQANAVAAALKATQQAQSLSDELVIAQAAAMAVTEKTVTVYTDRIVHAPTTSSCGPVVRDSARGVLSTLNPGGGAAAPVSRAP